MFTLNERLLDVEAGNNAVNEAIDELLVENYNLNVANTTINNANEILKKELEDLKAKDENKSKQIEMLYVVIEDKLGINVHAAFDEIEIRRAEARRIEKEKKSAEEAVEALRIKDRVLWWILKKFLDRQLFTMVGEPKTVFYTKEDNLRKIEVERRRLKAKQRKYEIVDEDDYDEELKEWFGDDDDDYHDGKDDDKDDNDDQGGTGGALIVKPPGANQVDDYLNDE
ncbi:hypothetical protein Hanom_Chr08g00716131 [Helianthus anomalus]